MNFHKVGGRAGHKEGFFLFYIHISGVICKAAGRKGYLHLTGDKDKVFRNGIAICEIPEIFGRRPPYFHRCFVPNSNREYHIVVPGYRGFNDRVASCGPEFDIDVSPLIKQGNIDLASVNRVTQVCCGARNNKMLNAPGIASATGI